MSVTASLLWNQCLEGPFLIFDVQLFYNLDVFIVIAQVTLFTCYGRMEFVVIL